MANSAKNSSREQAPAGARIPPHSYEAEESVLGSLLIDKDAIMRIADFLAADDFYRDAHRKMYKACLELYESSQPIDVLSLSNKLREKKQLEEVGSEDAVTHLATVVPTSGNVVHYGRIVQKYATLRRLISAASTISNLGFEEEPEVEETLDEAERLLFSVSRDHKSRHFTKISEALEEAFERIDKLQKGADGLRGITTGFPALDRRLAGWQKSDLVVLAARPSMGKTTLALDFARHASLSGVPVGLFSLEMSKEQLVDRLMSAHAHVDLWRIRTGRLQAEGEFDDFARLGHAISELSEAPLYIDDQASNNVMGMRTMARRLQSEHGLGLLIVDYLQLMESRRYSDNRVQEVSDISRSLKKLALELNIPIIALSQLSRAVEMRASQRPKLSDLRESGCLTGDTLITRADTGERVTIKSLADRKTQKAVPILALDKKYNLVTRSMTKAFSSGHKRACLLRTRSGREIRASANHPFLTTEGWRPLEKLSEGDRIATARKVKERAGLSWRSLHARINTAYCGNTITKSGLSRERLKRVAVALKSDKLNDLAGASVLWDEIVSIEARGVEEVYDATVSGLHNFVANDIIVHNSIEQDSDIVMFIHRTSTDDNEEGPAEAEVEDLSLLIEKHRNGPTGEIPLRFHRRYVTCLPPDDRYDQIDIPPAEAGSHNKETTQEEEVAVT